MLCKAFVNQRKPLLQCAALCISEFENLSTTDKFIQIMQSENNQLITALGTYLIDTAKCPYEHSCSVNLVLMASMWPN